MRLNARWTGAALAVAACVALPWTAPLTAQSTQTVRRASRSVNSSAETSAAVIAAEHVARRRDEDLAALAAYRPGFSFWEHVFAVPDGSIAFGSARDGHLVAVLPTQGDWSRSGRWADERAAGLLNGRALPRKLNDRRDQVAALLEPVVGPVTHNPTRGSFLLPNVDRYGVFLDEWAAIYERFGVPANIGLAQAAIESGLHPTRRSRANAVGFCQWLARNWKHLDSLAPEVIESGNQTTQAAYCAAYLSILATKYGSFIPALSEHHSGGTNVGRTLILGDMLKGDDVRDKYFLGSEFAQDLRQISLMGYRDLYRTYGPRSATYAEMVFANTATIAAFRASTPQRRVFAMRTSRAIPITEIARRTRLTTDEIKRYNPALVKRVPAGATVYLPSYVKEFGRDVSFWHREADEAFSDALNDFVHLDADPREWDDPDFWSELRAFQRRFVETKSEEGLVMATVLAYVIDDARTNGRGQILAEYEDSERVRDLFDRGMAERQATRGELTARPWEAGEAPVLAR